MFFVCFPRGQLVFTSNQLLVFRAAPRLAQDASRLAKGSGVPEQGDPLHEFLLQTGGPAWDHGDQPTNQPTKRLVKAKPAQKLEILKRVFSWLSINQCILQQKNKVLNYLCLWHSVRGKIILKKSWESYHGWCFWSCFQESSNQKWYWAITNRC